LKKEYVYRGGQLLATIEPSNGVKIGTPDHLGSMREWTHLDGSLVVDGTHDYTPFGTDLYYGEQRDGQRQQFDAYERDNETGLDFAQARYFSNLQGRFTSVDPESEEEANGTPQSWNSYSFVLNNPLKLKDPDGRKYKICSPDGKECHSVDDDDFYRARKVGKADGYSFSGSGDFYEKGELRDKDGKLIATYQQVSIDDPTREFIYQMRERAPATKQAIGLFAGGGALIGTGVGGGLYLGGIAFGSGVTTLGLSGGATSAEASTAVAAEEVVKAIGGKITGYTRHGLNQAISRDGVGVSPRAILDAVKNPLRSIPQSNGAMKYVGEKATVILNQAGKVISTWARSSAGTRIQR
jgi:RHS repeat-associated protein